jgi:hypothetical protein
MYAMPFALGTGRHP